LSQLAGIDSSSERPLKPVCVKMLATFSGCEPGPESSLIPCVEPEVIAM
jgi:hypothetical protein